MRNKLFYGWIVVAVGMATVLVAAGIRSAPGVFLKPMMDSTGFSRVAISGAVFWGLMLFGAAAPISGYLMDKLGPRKMILSALSLMGLSMILSARLSTELEMNAFWGVLSGIATGIIGGVLGATIANRWFIARRGLVLGMFGAATSAGQLVFIRLLASTEQIIGWRNSVLILAALSVLLIPLVLWLMRDTPQDAGTRPLGATDDIPIVVARPKADTGIMALAIATPAFWLLASTFFFCGFTSNGIIGTHFMAHTADHGIPTDTSANMLAVLGLMNFVGTLGSGWLTDRYDPRKLLFVYYTFRGISLLFLPLASTSQLGLTLFAILFGLDYIATVPPTSALCADIFGRKNVGTVYGWVFCAHQVGAALSATAGGVMREAFGTYAQAFIMTGMAGLIAAGLALMIRRDGLATRLKTAV